MISLVATPYSFGFGLAFTVGQPAVNPMTMEQGHLWGFNILVAFLHLQVTYVRFS